jgi:soluble lytic murein transglycosylase-like protein
VLTSTLSMSLVEPRRTVLGGLCLVLLSVAVGGRPSEGSAGPPEGGAPDVADAEAAGPGDGRAAEDADPPGEGSPAADPSASSEQGSPAAGTSSVGAGEGSVAVVEGPLRGRPGAATALAVHDSEAALALLEAEPAPVEGSPAWFVHGALRARALRMDGRPGEAVAVLEPRLARKDLGEHFPRDVLGLELALARVGHAESEALAVPAADEQRRLAAAELRKLEKLDVQRTLGAVRVLRAEALAGVEGETPKAAKAAAVAAAAALGDIVEDYPNHPRIGLLRLEHAQALVRAGKRKDAAELLRRITIERAGEPESEQAWTELTALAAADRKLKVPPLGVGERLEQAMHARSLRRVEASRRLLDDMIADPKLSASLRRQARRSRAWTASKQRDFTTCVADLRALEEAGFGDRGQLLGCLERGELYDDALALWKSRIASKKKMTRLDGLWNGIELAVRAGRYEQAEAWLGEYEKASKGHRGTRAWLRPWLAYRRGRDADAIAGFRALADGRSGDARRARYFLGKLLVAAPDPAMREEGRTVLQQITAGDAWGYYGLMARQRLLDAGLEAPPVPELTAVADEAWTPSRARAEARFAELDASYGAAWPTLRRARQLYEAGYLEEARRELRVTTGAYIDIRNGKQAGPRSEGLVAGLAWKAEWDYPRAKATSAGRRTLRDPVATEALRVGLRALSHDLDEPAAWSKLSDRHDGSWRARWHPRAYRASVEREARLRAIDPIHMWSLMYTESRFRRHVVSPVGARGALQIMPWTGYQLAQRLGELPPDDRFDPDVLFDIDVNAHLAGYYVAELLHKFHGQAPMAYGSYNGGPSNIGRWLRAKSKEGAPLEVDAFVEEIVFVETHRYVKRVVEVSAAYSVLYTGELPRWSNAVDPVVEDNIAF